MIIYDLSCDNGHRFEGWFRSAADFDDQLERRLIACPQCDNHQVRRVPSAVAIGGHAEAAPVGTAAERPTAAASTALMPGGAQVMALYRQLVQAIVDNSEDVGTAFVDEARRIHYNEAPERPIRGQATPEECEELRDEGINVLNLPTFKEEIN